MSLLEESKTYKPFKYPFAMEVTEDHEKIHWGTWELKLQEDVDQWKKEVITPEEKNHITQIFRLFTQSDVQVATNYCDLFIPKFKNNEIRPFASALLGIARDGNKQITAIQMTYLDPITGNKITDLPIKKRSMGALKGSVVELHTPQDNPKYCIAAEGIETALSIKNGLDGLQKDAVSVVATLGISNFSHLNTVTKAQIVVLILDNDGVGVQSQKLIGKAISKLKSAGKTVITMKPEMIDGQKTDYNDLLKNGKLDQIRADIKCAFAQKEVGLVNSNSPQSDQKSLNPNEKTPTSMSAEREIFG